METLREKYENIAQKFSLSHEQLLRDSLRSYLLSRQREFMSERLEIFSKYRVTSIHELEEKIKQGTLPEHPSWEDLIDLNNLESEIQDIIDSL